MSLWFSTYHLSQTKVSFLCDSFTWPLQAGSVGLLGSELWDSLAGLALPTEPERRSFLQARTNSSRHCLWQLTPQSATVKFFVKFFSVWVRIKGCCHWQPCCQKKHPPEILCKYTNKYIHTHICWSLSWSHCVVTHIVTEMRKKEKKN